MQEVGNDDEAMAKLGHAASWHLSLPQYKRYELNSCAFLSPVSCREQRIDSCLDPPIFSDGRVLGCINWTGPGGLRYPFAAMDESYADLPTDQKSPRGPTPPRLYQTCLRTPAGEVSRAPVAG